MSWLSQTVPPENPELIRQWRDDAEAQRLELKEIEANDLEVFRNVRVMIPVDPEIPIAHKIVVDRQEEEDVDIGIRVYYRNILDQYPQIGRSLAHRLARGNWQRQKWLTNWQDDRKSNTTFIGLSFRFGEEREICRLPPLPLPLTNDLEKPMLCYICHSSVRLYKKEDWR